MLLALAALLVTISPYACLPGAQPEEVVEHHADDRVERTTSDGRLANRAQRL